jgi:hypothetical protein
MRIVCFPGGPKRPTHTDARNLGELVMLTEAAISVTNVRRWAARRIEETTLARAATRASGQGKPPAGSAVPPEVAEKAKTRQYEVSVVDEFVQLGAQSFAAHGTEAVWERPILTGRKGRPKAVDVALFNGGRSEESRLEFGEYTVKKLKDDAKKLASLPQDGELKITNYLILWRIREDTLTNKSVKAWLKTCEDDAAAASESGSFLVKVRLVSSQDLFVAESNKKRTIETAIFSVDITGKESQEEAGDV